MMNIADQTNGNTQLNTERNQLNRRVSKLNMLSKSKKIQWDGM